MHPDHANNDLDRIFETARAVRLSSDDRAAQRAQLTTYMRLHQRQSRTAAWRMLLRPIPAFALAGVLVFMSSVAYAAEQSLPGEKLYGLKVNVIEPVSVALSLTSETKIGRQADILEQRLRETEALVAQGKLTPQLKLSVAARVNASAETLQREIEELDNSGKHDAAADAQASVEGTLEAHSEALRDNDNDEDERGDIKDLLKEVEQKKELAREHGSKSEERVQQQERPQAEAAARGRLKAAQNKVREVQRFIDQRRGKYQPAQLDKAQARLGQANQSIQRGSNLIEQQKFGEAFQVLQSALRQAQEAKQLANRAPKLNAESRTNVNLNRPADDRREDEDQEDRNLNVRVNVNVSVNSQSEPPEDEDERRNDNRNSDD
ncbi:MAG: hypothetical protein HY976_01260 [Candidatus Kerfeldbacteria bacterium]|nr:hypothetical protein [Candidatus Kerfeldbacteria bacterium]